MSELAIGYPDLSTSDKLRLSQVVLYAVLLAPVSLIVAGSGVSANYLFALLLLFPEGYRQNKDALVYVVFISLSFLVGVLLFSGLDGDFLLRQTISFGLTMLGALLLFLRLKVRREEFLAAVVLASVLYSAFAIWIVATRGFSLANIFFIKSGMREYVTDWPQRYAVILVFAFFVALGRWTRGLTWALASLAILSCIFLTFTRAAWLGVFVGGVIYLARWPKRFSVTSRRSRIYVLVSAAVTVGLLIYVLSNELVSQALMRIFDRLWMITESNPAELSVRSSEGYRLALWGSVLKVLETNPISGTGFAGANLVIEGVGSAHSEYVDVLLRTGAFGLFLYLWFWGKLLRFYKRVDRSVLAGLVAIFVIGFFHETTKLSYGALIFFVLLNQAYQDAGSRPPIREPAIS